QGLCMFDRDNSLIVCNERYVSIFNADSDVVKPGVTLKEIFEHGASRGIYSEPPEAILARRLAALARRQPMVYDQELTDGRIIAISVTPMANGGWVGTYEDITERRRVEAERAAAVAGLREQHRRFDGALNNMSHGLCMLDADLRVTVCNRQYLEIFGHSPD